jgi:hypothetical protein
MKAMNIEPSRPSDPIRLGDEMLLAAGMLEAADHFKANRASIPGNHLRARQDEAQAEAA